MSNYVGLGEAEIAYSREQNGRNILTPPPSTPWYVLFGEKFKDPIIIILIVAAVVSILTGSYIESGGILIAIALATGVGFWMEWSAKKKFDVLNQVSDTELIKVWRSGTVHEVPKDQLVVGDIVILSTGDEVPADLDLLEATELKIDESSMTGESVPAGKRAKTSEENFWHGSGFAPWSALRSTKVMEGSGVGVVVSVGDNTVIGKTQRAAMEETDNETPLNIQLEGLAGLINKAAFTIAAILLIILNVRHFFFTEYDPAGMAILEAEIQYVMIALALVICAVPEGLPLASTLSLAFSMKTMAKDNNLVKKMHACETSGCINVICSDKTGTLTQNKMSVVATDFQVDHTEEILYNIAINSSANLGENNETIGNPSEGAMLRFISPDLTTGLNSPSVCGNYKTIRSFAKILSQKPFNSTDKYMSTTIEVEDKELVLVKGAPEVIARLINDSSYLDRVAEEQGKGRRAISMASGPDMDHLVYDGTVFIEDPIRPDVPQAVADCYNAGIDVIMMTGDNVKTAAEIARQAGFSRKLQGHEDEDVWAIEAKDFEKCAWGDPLCGYPNVIARCKPEDKLNILNKFQSISDGSGNRSYICAMTGDGTNDAPSLNHADVGIAMGSGTSVAKEAADIVLLDDAFPSIVTGVKWGRSLYKNIQSFLTFQLIINLATCLVVLCGPIVGVDMPFTVTQMLWVNIVMDTLAALCLASEPADPNVLKDMPRKQGEFIVTKNMWKTIIGIGLVVWALLTGVVYDIAHEGYLGFDLSMLFAIFMTLNWWNLFNIRVFGKGRSVFHNLGANKNFLWGSVVILVGTIGIVQFGGEVFSTRPLDWKEWLLVFGITSPVLIIRELWYQIKK